MYQSVYSVFRLISIFLTVFIIFILFNVDFIVKYYSCSSMVEQSAFNR